MRLTASVPSKFSTLVRRPRGSACYSQGAVAQVTTLSGALKTARPTFAIVKCPRTFAQAWECSGSKLWFQFRALRLQFFSQIFLIKIGVATASGVPTVDEEHLF